MITDKPQASVIPTNVNDHGNVHTRLLNKKKLKKRKKERITAGGYIGVQSAMIIS